jgi:pantetheine-phosphate adenylyltransferase
MKKGVYAASFDPITNGHLWCIEQGVKIFDQLIVAIGVNPEKKYTFPLRERVKLVQETTKQYPNVVIETYENQLLVHYAKLTGAEYILRGIRTETDYEYERAMRHINSDLNSEIVTLFLMPPREIAEVSSSVVKGLVGLDQWEEIIKKYVPEPVFREFVKRFGSSR